MHYPLSFIPEEDEIVVRSRHLPELLTSGKTMAEALELAEDALTVVLLTYIEKGLPLPAPDACRPDEIDVHPTDEVVASLA